VDGEPALVEHVRPADVLDLELGRLERARLDDEVALLLQDAMHPRDDLLRLAGRLDDERVVVLVLEVAGFVGAQSRERGRHRRRLEPDGRHGREVDFVGHVALYRGPWATRAVRTPARRCSMASRRARRNRARCPRRALPGTFSAMAGSYRTAGPGQ